MRLFSERGFRGTTVASIEEAAGLSPGAGGLYHHFESKDAVLAAGLERHLRRIDEMRELRDVFSPLDDTGAEFTVMARFVLTEINRERELFRILVTEAQSRPQILSAAVDRLFAKSFGDFALWLQDRSDGGLEAEEARSLAEMGLGALMWFGLQQTFLGVVPRVGDDDAFIATWVASMSASVESSLARRAR